jgi:hypothetical protein
MGMWLSGGTLGEHAHRSRFDFQHCKNKTKQNFPASLKISVLLVSANCGVLRAKTKGYEDQQGLRKK